MGISLKQPVLTELVKLQTGVKYALRAPGVRLRIALKIEVDLQLEASCHVRVVCALCAPHLQCLGYSGASGAKCAPDVRLWFSWVQFAFRTPRAT